MEKFKEKSFEVKIKDYDESESSLNNASLNYYKLIDVVDIDEIPKIIEEYLDELEDEIYKFGMPENEEPCRVLEWVRRKINGI